MSYILRLKFILLLVCGIFALSSSVQAQTEEPARKKVNFGYSQNPKTKVKVEEQEVKTEEIKTDEVKTDTFPAAENVINAENSTNQNPEFESRSIASKTLEIAKRSNEAAISPTEIYKIGIGDVLFISLQNAPNQVSTYFTVLNDGSIDYPLAGELMQVNNLTTEEVEDLLKEKIKLYENPQVSVKVREHSSHTIMVLGMVEKTGEKYLQREAMPLFIIKAEAIVQPKANLAVIKRANLTTEKINLKDSKADDVLIFPGDIVEFKSADSTDSNSAQPQFYYIGGNIASAGQKDYYQGLTLTQAILASGGLKKASLKKIVVRRKNQDNMLNTLEFDLSLIKAGKQPDPNLQAGDTIEIGN